MRLSLKIVGGLVALVVLALVSLTFVDVNNFKPEIEAAVEEQTGRKLTLGGPIRIGLSFAPTIVAEDVTFANAAWGSQAEMMRAAEVAIGLSIVNAFGGEVEVARVGARDVSLFLESHANGQANWDIRSGVTAEAAENEDVEAADRDPFVVPSLDLRNVDISYRSGRTGQVVRGELDQIELQNSFAGLGLQLEGVVEGQRLLIAGGLDGSPGDFRVSDMIVRYGSMRFNGDLSARRETPAKPYSVVSHIRAGRIETTTLAEALLTDESETGEVEAESDPAFDLSFLSLVDGDVTLEIERVDFRRVSLKHIKARLKSAGRTGRAEISAQYEGKQLALVADVIGKTLPVFTLEADVQELDVGVLASDAGISDDVVATAKGTLDLQASGATVSALIADLSGKIDGEVLLDRIDLTSFDQPDDENGTQVEEANGFVFDNEPLPLNMVDGFSGKLTVKAEEVRYRDLVVTKIDLPLVFDGRHVTASLEAIYKERAVRIANDVRLDGEPRFVFDVAADDFDLGELLAETGATDLITVRADLAAHGEAQGRSLRQIASSFTGEINLVAGDGEIASRVVELIASDLAFALVPKGGDGGVAKLSCVVAGLKFDNGVGDMRSFALVTQRMRTGGAGTIDLNDETLDLVFIPKPNDVSLLSLSTPIRVGGTLSDPSVSPDTGALLVDVATAVGAGIFTGGLGAILPLMSVQNFDAEDAGACMSMLESGESGGKRGGLVGTVGAGAGAVKDGAAGVVEGIGDVLTSPFK